MPLARPLVSVVTPSFNQSRYLEKTLRSVLHQSYALVEYLVIDGGSTDETAALLRRYRGAVDVLMSEPDRGQADALHKGFALASGDVLAWLNADDCYASPEAIARVVAHFKSHPEVDVLFGRRVVVDAAGRFVSRWPRIRFHAETLRHVDFIPQECCFWRRSVWERAGACIDRSFDFAMDYELWLRFLACGARFLAVGDTIGLFRQHGEQKSQADWHDKGWPEVRRLHAREGITLTPAEMETAFARHVFGAGWRGRPRRAWHALGDRWVRWAARGKPLDAWVFDRPAPNVRGQARSA